ENLAALRAYDPFSLPASRLPPRELRPSRKNFGDRPGAAALPFLEQHVVADGELRCLRRGGHGISPERTIGAAAGIRLLQSAAHRRVDRVALLGPHAPDAARPA